MAILLGIDTGGTYTDAVLMRDEDAVIASAKSPTTRHDLAIGIGKAVQAVLDASDVDPSEIAMASLSTTLATNALVEGQGARIGLIYIGFAERDLTSQGLYEALAGDPVLVTVGGHSHSGAEVAALDLAAIVDWASAQDVSSFAIAAQFATRNPAHEIAARDAVREATLRPVTCSHELSAKLGGPKRALTAVLNARLIGLTHRLITRAEEALTGFGIDAPLMVVRGDGALMSAEQAKERPIETILSGPAASIEGARWLTGEECGLVSDIGGTTTDIALLQNGRPKIDPNGAQVGPHRTMVEAVAMRTHGLGGDSEVHVGSDGLDSKVTLGPRRVVPVSVLAGEAREVIHAALDEQLGRAVPGDHDGRFVRLVAGQDHAGVDGRARAVLERLTGEVQPLASVVNSRLEQQSLRKLIARGIAQISAATPTDALHVQGRLSTGDTEAACKVLALLARKRTGAGVCQAETAKAMADTIVSALTKATGIALLEAAFAGEGADDPAALAANPMLHRGLRHETGLVHISAGLNVPVIGLGASAATTYPAVGEWLNCQTLLPEHGDVANAIGAVTGRIRVQREGLVSCPLEGRYRAHLAENPQDFPEVKDAIQAMEDALRRQVSEAATSAGAGLVSVDVSHDVKSARVEARDIFVEARITVVATGRPRIAVHDDLTLV